MQNKNSNDDSFKEQTNRDSSCDSVKSNSNSTIKSIQSNASPSKSNKFSPKATEIIKHAYKNIMSESELQVKIADLGNACWTVNSNTYLQFNLNLAVVKVKHYISIKNQIIYFHLITE